MRWITTEDISALLQRAIPRLLHNYSIVIQLVITRIKQQVEKNCHSPETTVDNHQLVIGVWLATVFDWYHFFDPNANGCGQPPSDPDLVIGKKKIKSKPSVFWGRGQ